MVIHPDKLHWLLWMRWKLFLRGFAGNIGRIITTIFMVVFLGPAVVGISIATYLAYHFLASPLNEEILFLVLTGVYVLWIVLPLFEFNVNEGLDVSKLTLFPLSRTEIMTSLLFSTLLDLPTLGLVLIFSAVVAGWAISVPVALFTVLAMLVFYVQVVGMSQLILALLMRTLQSRRFRDLSIIIIILFSSVCSIGSQFISRVSLVRGAFTPEKFANAGISSYLQWLPPGMAARSVQQAVHGNWAASFAWLGGLLIVSVFVLYLWQVVIERSLSAPEGSGGAQVRRNSTAIRESAAGLQPAHVSASTSVWKRIFSPQVLAIAVKELKYYWRDPQLKALLFQSLATAFILIGIPLINSGGSGAVFSSGGLVVIAPLSALLAMLTFSLNTLGMERKSLTALFLFPIAPQRILWGKNLAVSIIGLAEMIPLIVTAAFITRAWNVALPSFIVGLAGMGIVLGCGNFTSVLLPQRMREMQRGFRATGSSAGNAGCTRAALSLVMLFVTVVLLLPVVLALVLPVFFHVRWVWLISMPLSLLYGLVFHQVVTRLVAPRIVDKAPEILAITTRE